MLSVGAGFAEDDGTGDVVHFLAKAVDRLAVGFHVELLEMRREAAERLRVRQNGSGRITLYIALIDTDQGIEHVRVLQRVRILGQCVLFCSPVEETLEDFRTEGQGEDSSADTGSGGVASADVVVHEEGGEIIAAGSQRRGLAGDRNHMLCGIKAGIAQGILDEGFIGQGFQGCAGLGNENEQGTGDINALENACGIVGVDVADKACIHMEGSVLLCPVFESKIHGAGAKIAAADTDLHNRGKGFTLGIGDFTLMHAAGKLCDFLLLCDIEFTLVYAVSHDIIAQLAAGQLMENKTFFTRVDDFSIVQSFILGRKLGLLGECFEGREDFIIDHLGCIVVGKTSGHGNCILGNTLGTVLTGHYFGKADMVLECKKLFVAFGLIKIVPGNHENILLSYQNAEVMKIINLRYRKIIAEKRTLDNVRVEEILLFHSNHGNPVTNPAV